MTVAKSPATFGAWVRTRRKQLDLTQSELGKRAGCSEAAIRKIEADERKPSRQLAELLAAALEIPVPEKESFLQFSRGILTEEIRTAPKSHQHNLPTLLTSTIDRTRDLANVSALFKDPIVHLVTLIGPPGIGKTRLSIHCGNELLDEFPDGVWFVDLADVTNADFFIPTIARFLPTLNLPPSPNLTQLINGLKEKSLLLILDNFEQITENASLEVAQMLKNCPNVKILVTSRVPLHIYGESEYPLPPLSIPPPNAVQSPELVMQFEAVQLFVARTRQHQPNFSITPENADFVIEICAILEGIPLALELAAATLRQMTLAEMVSLLHGKDWISQLATPARDLPQRQRTLEKVIDWSYTLLNRDEKDFLCRLGIFSGWFDADAVTYVCKITSSKANTLLTSLTAHSLLVREIIHGKAYWRMLELIHNFADSKLSKKQRWQIELLRVHYFLEKMQEFKSRHAQAEYFQIHFSNFLGALKWTIASKQSKLGFQLVSQLESVWELLGYYKEGLSLLSELLALPSEITPEMRANFLQTASDLAWQQHDFETAIAYSKEAVELGRQHSLKGKYSAFVNRLGRIYIEQGRYAEARSALEEGLELAWLDPDNVKPGIPLAQLGELALFEGKLAEAKTMLEQALAQQMGDDEKIFIAMATTDLAEIALAEGELLKAMQWLEKSFPYASQHPRRFLVLLCTLAGYLVLSPNGDLGKAAQFYGAIEFLSEHSGVILSGVYENLNQQRKALIRKQLAASEWQAKFASGQQWSRETALGEATILLHAKEKQVRFAQKS